MVYQYRNKDRGPQEKEPESDRRLFIKKLYSKLQGVGLTS